MYASNLLADFLHYPLKNIFIKVHLESVNLNLALKLICIPKVSLRQNTSVWNVCNNNKHAHLNLILLLISPVPNLV